MKINDARWYREGYIERECVGQEEGIDEHKADILVPLFACILCILPILCILGILYYTILHPAPAQDPCPPDTFLCGWGYKPQPPLTPVPLA